MHTLLDHGARVSDHDNDCWTTLHWAARDGHVETVVALLDRRAENTANKSAWQSAWSFLYPERYYSDDQYRETFDAILDHAGGELNVNARCFFNFSTPLHHASEHGHVETVRTLLAHDADVNMRDVDGKTPLDRASKDCNTEEKRRVVALLRAAGATA